MSASLLARLQSDAPRVARMDAGDRLVLIQYLLDWGAVEESLACLALVPADEGPAWTLLAADALNRGGRAPEAIELLQGLLAVRPSLDGEAALVRSLVAAGSLRAALERAEMLVEREGRLHFGAWTALGDVQLALGRTADAEVAFTQAQRLAPADLAPRLGLLRAALLEGDDAAALTLARAMVTAASGFSGLHNEELQTVRQVFATAGDTTGVNEINHTFKQRLEKESERMRALLARRVAAPRTLAPASGASAASQGRAISERERTDLRAAARTHFGYATLLPHQAEIMAAARRGEDVLAILPTGGGKSLTYQLPAFLDEGVTVVVAPLIALMKDQLDGLPPRLRGQAVALGGGMDAEAMRATLAGIGERRFRLVYTSPERLRQRSFVHLLARTGVSRLVIDEAHCVSVWGHDFRPDYLHLGRAHADMGSPPVLALTATAPPVVRADIERQLFDTRRGRQPRPYTLFATDPARANLWLGAAHVRDEAEKQQRVAALCRTLPGSGIVYVRSRAQAEEIAALLRTQQIQAAAYHAAISDRTQVQEQFMQGKVRIVVATIAFGMGVDKGDIRFVIHCGLPSSLEAYSQEVGRAGRDGEPATCMLYYHARDLEQSMAFVQRDGSDINLLQGTLDAVAAAAGEHRICVLALDRVAAALQSDETGVRVALSLLEQAGLVERTYDAPRTVSLYLRQESRTPSFVRLVQQSHLRAGHPVEWPFLALARAAGLDPARFEAQLIEWQEKGWINYYANGREAMVVLRAAPSDAARRVQKLVAERQQARHDRAAAVARFVQAGDCRHRMLGLHMGSNPPRSCRQCDNCGVPLSRLFADTTTTPHSDES